MNSNLAENLEISERGESTLIIPDVASDYMLDEDPFDSYYISQRYLLDSVNRVNSGERVSLVQYDMPETQELMDIYSEIFPNFANNVNVLEVPTEYYKPTEFLTGMNYDWQNFRKTSGFELDFKTAGLAFNTKRKAIDLLNNSSDIILKSYKVTPELRKIKDFFSWRTNSIIAGEDDFELVNTLWGKSFIHENLDWSRKFDFSNEVLNHFPKWVLVEKTDWVDWLRRWIEVLREKNITKFLVKPVNASSGEGIEIFEIDEVTELDNYNFDFGDVVLEEFCDLKLMGESFDKEYANEPLSISVQFNDGKLIWSPTIQLTKDNEFKWNLIINQSDLEIFGLPLDILEQINFYSSRLINELGLTWSGGFDFLIENDWNFVMIDPNLWRDTWAFPLKNFESANILEGNNCMLFSKVLADNIYELVPFIEALSQNGVNLLDSNSNSGILPVSFVGWEHLALIMYSDSLDSLKALNTTISEVSEQDVYGKVKNSDRFIKSAWELIEYNAI